MTKQEMSSIISGVVEALGKTAPVPTGAVSAPLPTNPNPAYKFKAPTSSKTSDAKLLAIVKQNTIHRKGEAVRFGAPTMTRDVTQTLEHHGLNREQIDAIYADAAKRGVLYFRQGFRLVWAWDQFIPRGKDAQQAQGEDWSKEFAL